MTNGKLIFGEQPVPKNWQKAGRHSTQGFTLSDMVSPERMKKIVQDVVRYGMLVQHTIYSHAQAEYLMDMQFRQAFFAKKFGELNMVKAAAIYVDYLEDVAGSEVQHETESDALMRRLKTALMSVDPKKFFVLCLHHNWPMPADEQMAIVIMHSLRLEKDFIPELEKQQSREYLATRRRKP